MIIQFPEDAGFIDVTAAPYNADPADNNNDDTSAILKALEDYAGESKIIYLPDGVYNISKQIVFPKGQSGWKWAGNRLQGQSSDSTIIKLNDNANGFGDPNNPQAVIRTTGFVEDWNVAQRFNNDVANLTINTGQDNPGAIGLQFMSNNTGILEDIIVVSGDGQGKYGVDLGFANENGPLLVKDLIVNGFNVGLFTSSSLNSQTFENITLLNQNLWGWQNNSQKVSVRNLVVKNSGKEAIFSSWGNFVLIGGELTTNEQSSYPAINLNSGYGYLRDISALGYQKVLESTTPTGSIEDNYIDEYVSHHVLKAFANSPDSSLNLPIEDTPDVPWDPFSDWVNIKDFGAKETDGNSNDNDDEIAIQQAIDSGAKTVYFPNEVTNSYPKKSGSYEWNTVYVRGNVHRFIGMESGRSGWNQFGTFVIEEEGPPVIVFERLNDIKIINKTSRIVVVKNASARIEASGSGKTFLEDVVTGGTTSIKVSNGHQLYARQLNPEWNGNSKPGEVPIIDNNGGLVWILGMKTETGGTIVRTTNGGQTEILGGHQYDIGTPETGNNDNMFIVENASFSITSMETNFGGGEPYDTYLRETRNGITYEVNRSDIPYGGSGNAKSFPLLVAHNPKAPIIPSSLLFPLSLFIIFCIFFFVIHEKH